MSVEEIKLELIRAQKALRAARTLCAENLFEDSVSRAYYSVLHAAKAVLLSKDVNVSSHEAVKRLFGQHFIKTEIFLIKFAYILREEQDDRILADYDVAFCPPEDQVLKRIDDAQEFFDQMEKYLIENGRINHL